MSITIRDTFDATIIQVVPPIVSRGTTMGAPDRRSTGPAASLPAPAPSGEAH